MTKGESLQPRQKWQLPSIMSILSPQRKVSHARSTTIYDINDGLPRHVFVSRRRNHHEFNSNGFDWDSISSLNSFEKPQEEQININNFCHCNPYTLNNFVHSSPKSLEARKQSSPLLIEPSHNRSSKITALTRAGSVSLLRESSSIDDHIRANQYIYSMATWRMYKRIETARAQKRIFENMNASNNPSTFLPSNLMDRSHGRDGVCLEEKSSNSEHDFDEKAVENDKDHEDVYRDGDSESYGHADQFQIEL